MLDVVVVPFALKRRQKELSAGSVAFELCFIVTCKGVEVSCFKLDEPLKQMQIFGPMIANKDEKMNGDEWSPACAI